jgi:hypothetical protein
LKERFPEAGIIVAGYNIPSLGKGFHLVKLNYNRWKEDEVSFARVYDRELL